MADGLSLSELARQLGRAKSGLHKLAKAGQIPQLADSSYDLGAVQKALAANLDPARKADPAAVRGPVHRSPAGERPAVNDAATPTIRTEADAKVAVALIRRVLEAEGVDAGAIDFNAARTADTILKAYERDLKMAQKRRELVPLAQQQKHVSDAIVALRQIYQRMPSRHGAAMAAELGVSPTDLDRVLSRAIAADLEDMSKAVAKDPA